MDKTRFSHQPTLVKIAVGLTVYNAFVFFEELIVDRYGIWQYLPFYKFGKLCVWDLAALVAIAWFTASASCESSRRTSRSMCRIPYRSSWPLA
jgi:hypothetical protein